MSEAIAFLRVLLKFALPGYLVLVFASALLGHMTPWKPAEPVFSAHQGQTPISLGFGYSAERETTRDAPRASRTYVFFPEVLRDPKVIVVSQIDDGMPIEMGSRISFWLSVLWIGLSLYGTWWFWLRSTRKGVV